MNRHEKIVHFIKTTVYPALVAVIGICGVMAFLLYGLVANEAEMRSSAKTAASTKPAVTARVENRIPAPQEGRPVITVNTDDKWPLSAKMRTVADQTVIIIGRPGSIETQFGSGVVIGNGLVLTANHVLEDEVGRPVKDIKVVCGEKARPAVKIAGNRRRDVALLLADCRGKTLAVDQRPLRAHESLYVIGYDFTLLPETGSIDRFVAMSEPSSEAGIVFRPPDDGADQEKARVARLREAGARRLEPIAGIYLPGESGSIVTRRNGGIVGLVVWTNLGKARGYITPAANIRHVLRQAGIK